MRFRIRVRGIVQGVGFRPFVYRLAKKSGLTGYVLNDTAGVLIEVSGERKNIELFLDELRSSPPPRARIDEIAAEEIEETTRFADFTIASSKHAQQDFVSVSPDIATCDQCLSELTDPRDRRYHYPFLNCTNCGPRFSIVEDIPYDRGCTTMKTFLMCPTCKQEYDDPLNRRFHAQPNACNRCGPHVCLTDASGVHLPCEDAIAETARLIAKEKIIAIKGLGGYHLCCDATCAEAVQRLRKRKHRQEKPFALMMSSVKQAAQHCTISSFEQKLLTSPARPIVLLVRRVDCTLPGDIAGGSRYLGVMLPYTPLHHLLCRDIERPLVMTSGNVSDEPIAYTEEEAYRRLASIADAFLIHDRVINTRVDDSVVACVDDEILTFRRSRGYAPQPFSLGQDYRKNLLAVGGHSKNTFCIVRDGSAVVSHHIGDLENLEAITAFEQSIEHYQKLFRCDEPALVVCDLHPNYASTAFAKNYARRNAIPLYKVQHHHAHLAAVLGEQNIHGNVIGVVFDGSGYGGDGTLWGGEFLIGSRHAYRRVGTFQPVGLPGGEAALREPWRMGLSYLYELYGSSIPSDACKLLHDMVESRQFTLVLRLLSKGLHCPRSSSVGRLFDAVSSLVGICGVAGYEGQAAVELEQVALTDCTDLYSFDIVREGDLQVVHTLPVIRDLVNALRSQADAGNLAGRFHQTLARIAVEMCRLLRKSEHIDRVVLAGGVFQNRLLLKLLVQLLSEQGFEVYWPHIFPPGDGALSLGQAVVGCGILTGHLTPESTTSVCEG